MAQIGIENPQGASSLGVNLDRIRTNLAMHDLTQVTDATKISPMILQRFANGDEVGEDELDRIVGYMRGEYSLSGISHDWVRRKLGQPEAKTLPLACTDLPVGRAFPSPLGGDAPNPVPQDAPPVLARVRGFRSQLKQKTPSETEQGMFGKRGVA